MIARFMAQPALPPNAFAGIGLACRRGERIVFERLDFVLPPGGALVLTGKNGSGKSSLLRLMAGLTPPLSGVLCWDGTDVAENPAAHRARLHFIGHADALKPVQTVAESIAFWAGMQGGAAPGAAGAAGAVDRALDRFGLAPLAGLPCRVLSAGQRRRVTLARLAASPAPLWLLDEPLTGLDSEAVADLHDAIAAHRAGGGRIVLSTHAPIDLAGCASLSLADFAARAGAAAFA
jgi:heme exporter protein A